MTKMTIDPFTGPLAAYRRVVIKIGSALLVEGRSGVLKRAWMESIAADVARLGARAFARGEAIAPERLEPAYLRDNVALTLEQQQALRASRR